MKNITLRVQLRLAFGGMVALVVGIATFATISVSSQSANFENYVNGLRARSEAAHLVMEAVGTRAIAARNLILVSNPSDREAQKKLAFHAHNEVQANLRKLNELAMTQGVPEDARSLIQKIDSIEQKYSVVALSIVDLALKDQKEEAIAKLNNECQPLLAALDAAMEEYAQLAATRSEQSIKAAHDASVEIKTLILLASIASTFVAIFAGVIITKRLLRSLGAEPSELRDAVSKIAEGDFTGHIQVSADDTSSVIAALEQMQTSLSTVVRSVRHDANLVSLAAAEISAGNNDLSSRTEQQASTLEETASSMEEMTSTVRQNTENARQANVLAISASDIASKGGDVVSQVVGTMDSISEASKKIVDIISVIDGIAFQTNILALNAAVEAARAGEQGRGFAVVATEVRSLAQRSASAAKEIKLLIDNSVERVEIGTKLAADAGATMSEVVDSVKQVTEVISDIVRASQEQSTGIEQINHAVSEMDSVTQQNASLVEQAAAAAESLRDQAGNLAQTVSAFKVYETNAHSQGLAVTKQMLEKEKTLSITSEKSAFKSPNRMRLMNM